MAAREDYARRKIEVRYLNVRKDPAALQEMLGFSRGRREVPVIVDEGKVTIGFGGT